MDNKILEDYDGFLRLPEVLKLIPVSKSTWWAGIKSGRYPQSVKLAERVTAWRVADIRELIEEMAETRNEKVDQRSILS